MAKLADYADKYSNIRFRREDGVLEMMLHTGGGSLVFNDTVHHDLGPAFHDVGADPENKVVILTGAGDCFCGAAEPSSFLDLMRADNASALYRARFDGRRLLSAFVDIDVPVIAAINGPVASHSELPVLADVVLASDTAFFQDVPHFPSGAVPGDGVHTVWMALLGPNRGRYFLLTGQRIGAREGLDLGFVGEVLPQDKVLERAWELARHWARLPRPVLVGTRHVLNYEWKRLLLEQLHNGLTEEMFAGAFMTVPPEDQIPKGPVSLIG